MEKIQPKLYVLIGVPASGKSTWVNAQNWSNDCAIVSTDYWVEREAKSRGVTYSEIFEEYMPTALELMLHMVELAYEEGRDIIWDQTSTTVSSRLRKIKLLPDYYKIAVVCKTPPMSEIMTRVNNRPGKNIPRDVIVKMIKNWEDPTIEEGFDEIWNIN